MPTREKILDAAERVFASYGYEGASMRQISEQARVAQALLHYHFTSKEKLYAAVFARRAAPINVLRETRLDALFAASRTPSLEEVLDVLFSSPAAALADSAGTSSLYQQLVTAISVADDKRSKSLMIRNYDPIACRFIQALQRVLPELTSADAVWAYLFALGARMQANARNGRAARLSGGKIQPGDTDAAHSRILRFVAAGIRELAARARLAARGTRSPAACRPRRTAKGQQAREILQRTGSTKERSKRRRTLDQNRSMTAEDTGL